jgi:type III secretion system chaperone
MNKDIIQLIKDALTHMGCPLSVISKVDPDAPIVFTFNNGVVMNLVTVNNTVWLWSPVGEYSDKLITQNGAKFLELIIKPYPFFVTGKMQLSNENGELMLQGLVNEESLEKASYFAATLQVFFDTAFKLRQVIKE